MRECLSFRFSTNSWRSIDQLSILTYVPFDIWNGDPIRPLHGRWCENELSTGEIQPPGVLSATFKRPGLLADVFLCQQDESQSNNWPGFDRHCMCLGFWFEAHNARLGGRFAGSDVMENVFTADMNND